MQLIRTKPRTFLKHDTPLWQIYELQLPIVFAYERKDVKQLFSY